MPPYVGVYFILQFQSVTYTVMLSNYTKVSNAINVSLAVHTQSHQTRIYNKQHIRAVSLGCNVHE